jgi:hypothetical protein
LIARRVATLGVKGFEVKIQPSVQDHLAYVIGNIRGGSRAASSRVGASLT